ncbi:MAG: four helix bundle protein [Bacteroidales bacterium]|nr:four helix bundle protein [Bacteroidales bacterium]
MKDKLDEIRFYQLAKELWNEFWEDSEMLIKDIRGREIARQMTKSIGSISANIEEGYGRGTHKEYMYFMKVSSGSARESKGWYERSVKLLGQEIVDKRVNKLDQIIAMETKSIQTLELKLNTR